MNMSEIMAIITLSSLIISFIGYWIYLYHKESSKHDSEDLPPSIKEYEPTTLMFLPPEAKPIEKEPLLHAKCPNCWARMTSNTCEYCDMTFYPEPDKTSDLISNTSPGCMRITQEGIFIESLPDGYAIKTVLSLLNSIPSTEVYFLLSSSITIPGLFIM